MTDNVFSMVSEAWRNDPEFRARMGADVKATLASMGADVPHEEVRVVADTPDTFHVVFPADPNAQLTDEVLGQVVGGYGPGTPTPQYQMSCFVCGLCWPHGG